MAETKTRETDASVEKFIAGVAHPTRQRDALALLALMRSVADCEPKMWGASIVGFGRYHYRYDSGHEGDAPRIGFSPRKSSISLYLTCAVSDFEDLLPGLGKHRTGAGCLYVNKLADVDMAVLEAIIRRGWELAPQRPGAE
jgi:hypothetical protein